MSLTRRCLPLAFLILALGCQPQEGSAPEESVGEAYFSAEAILADVAALSADAMEGRATGTSGEERAADYIEQRFREAGLQPVGDSYRQEVRLVGMQRRADSALQISGPAGPMALQDGVNVAFWSTAQQDAVRLEQAPLLFVGYGVQAPEYDWDDLKGTDVAGRCCCS